MSMSLVTEFEKIVKSFNTIVFGGDDQDVVVDGITKPTISKIMLRIKSQFNGLELEMTNLLNSSRDESNIIVSDLRDLHDQGEAEIIDLQNAIDIAAAAGAGANGWTALVVQDASGKNQQEINDEVVSIFRFGAICDGTLHKCQEWLDSGRFNSFKQLKNAYPGAVSVDDSIDSLALEKAMAKIGNTGHIRLGGKPVFNKDVNFPSNARGIEIFSNNTTEVKFTHTGHGFNFELVNENVGKNTLRNLNILGIDPIFPPEGYVDLSQGAGIRIKTAYDNTFINVNVTGFKYGAWLNTGFNNKCVGFCGFVGNQYGVYIDGGATNLNKFDGAKIRLNRKAGVVIDGGDTGPYPTMNTFVGAYIESNIPYYGGYLPPPGDGSHSVGVRLSRTYDNDFTGVYFENQDFDIILENLASYNNFQKVRHGPNATRQCKTWLKGGNIDLNDFTASKYVSFDRTTPSVISDNVNQNQNKFIDTVGYNFIESSMLCYNRTVIKNNGRHTVINGTSFGAITRDPQGYLSNPNETSGLTGIGTESASLNIKGYGEVMFGDQITAPTTITALTGAKIGQIIILKNYQPTHPITIKSSTDGINGLVLNGRRDCVLAAYSDSITFFVSGLGKIVEIGRTVQTGATLVEQSIGTWAPIVKNSGGTTIATTTATGRWVKNGRQLTVWFGIVASSDLTEPNYYSITGMPNLPQFALNSAGQASSATNATNANQKDVFSVDAATTGLTVRVSTQANFSNSDGFAGSATYIIA